LPQTEATRPEIESRPPIPQEDWPKVKPEFVLHSLIALHPGAVMEEDGYVTIVDRKKDMILTGGENVYSTEVENVLYMHPAILECAVIGVPDQKWGEAVKGIVVLKPNHKATEQEIVQFCKDRMAHYKAPKSIDFIEALPRTGSGKIHKKGLRDKYWEGYEKKVH